MALLFMDSFDHYATADVTTKWTQLYLPGGASGDTSQILASGGRRSSSAWRASVTGGTNGHTKVLSFTPPAIGDNTMQLGLAFQAVTSLASLNSGTSLYSTGSGAPGLVAVHSTGALQCWVRVNNDGSLSVLRGNVLLGTSSGLALVQGTFYYIEIRLTVHTTAGAATIRINGTTVLTLTSQNTASAGTNNWTEVRIGAVAAPTGQSPEWRFDDLYLLDGTGAAPLNNLLGDVRVDTRLPTGAGASTQWTPSAGANYAAVDDAAPNGDTDYVAAAASALTDTYALADAPSPGSTIFGVQHCLNLRKTDTGVCTVAPCIRHAGTTYAGADLSPLTTYAYGLQIAATNPGTGAAWVEADFNAAEFGFRRTS
jgi:hypothetical protein